MTVCQNLTDSLSEGDVIDAFITDYSKVFDLVPHYHLLTKLAASSVVPRRVVLVREFLVGRKQRLV
jgi:hypothetical protein